MKKIIYVVLFLIGLMNLPAQEVENYYVSGNTLNLRVESSVNADIVKKLHKYDNVEVLEIKDGWAKVVSNGRIGFVSDNYIKKGKAIVSSYEVRNGAICRDGSRSSATGRGACSHHGGVSYWTTRTVKDARIEN